MLTAKPPMGWNSWNTFAENVSESLIRETADAMADNGLLDAGYEYVSIDDCWAERERDADGRMVPSKTKFPGGIRSLADYIHKKGMKLGIYSCSGLRTCADYPGSFDHEYVDAETFASWQVDLLKYDFCYRPERVPGELLYRRIAMALRNSGRDILLSSCNWGCDASETWMRLVGADMWRSTGDISDNWNSIKTITQQQMGKAPYGAVGCFNDMDMLVVGMHGKGHVGLGGCTEEEYKTHFAIWCMLCSPLIIGCDVRSMTEETRNILLNRELIAIDQDEEARQPYTALRTGDDHVAWVRPLSGGDYAVLMVNFADAPAGMWLSWWDIGLPVATGYAFRVRDLWKHEDLGVYRECFGTSMPAHGCAALRLHLVKD